MKKCAVIGIFLAILVVSITCAFSVVGIDFWIDGYVDINPHIIAIPLYFVMFCIVLYTLRNMRRNTFSVIESIRDFINEAIYVTLGISTLLLIENPTEFNRTHAGVLLLCIGAHQFSSALIKIIGSFCCIYVHKIHTGINIQTGAGMYKHKLVVTRDPTIYKDALYLIMPQTSGFYQQTQVSEQVASDSESRNHLINVPLKLTFFNFTNILNFNRIASAYTFIRMASVIEDLPDQSVVKMYEHCMDVMTISYMFYLVYNFVLMIAFTIRFGRSDKGMCNVFGKNLWMYFVMGVLSVRYIGMVKFYYGFFHYLVDGTNNNFMFFLMPMIFVAIIVSIICLIGIGCNNQIIVKRIEKHTGPFDSNDRDRLLVSDSESDDDIQYSEIA